ncbi:hypothetical protein LSF60_16450 [Rhodococcus pyridinivorans]|uniref:hypothetical protein n=1 Tax=Rhodococcus TaxID=1827 RepID=UPI001E5857CC|nr:hypothetical protein [Rhodococcus pyridinivorans]UGQ56895.1 hypothetical protein LSF60_16450 [Rhodococcus pyridinivorans]
MAVILFAIFVGAGLVLALAVMAFLAAAWLLCQVLRLWVVEPVQRWYRSQGQCAVALSEVARIQQQATSAVLRLEAAALQAQADMTRLILDINAGAAPNGGGENELQ